MARRPLRRKVLIASGVLALVIVVVLGAAPRVASWVLPSKIEAAAGAHLNGELTIGRTTLTWFGVQRLRDVTLRGADGEVIADVSATVHRGLLGLLTSGGDLGVVTISGDANLIVDESGAWNIGDVVKKPSGGKGGRPAPAEPVRIPSGLAGLVKVDDLRITYVNPKMRERVGADVEAALLGVTASVDFGVGRDVAVTFKLDAAVGTHANPSARPMGSLSLDATVADLTDSDGVVQPQRASVKATIHGDDLPLGVADSIAHADGWLHDALGDRADASITIDAHRSGADVDVSVTSASAKGDVAASWQDGRLQLTRPATVTWSASGVTKRVSALASDDATAVVFESLPTVSLQIARLDVGLDEAGAIDVGTGATAMTIDVGPIEATVGGDRKVTVTPRTVTIDSADFSKGLAITSGAATAIEGDASGEFDTKLTLNAFAGPDGSPRIPGSVDGAIHVRHAPTALYEPFVSGFALESAVGPTIDLDLTATAHTGDLAAVHSTIDLRASAANISLHAPLRLDTTTLATTGDGFTVSIVDPTAGFESMLASLGVTQAGGVDVSGHASATLDALGSGPGALDVDASVVLHESKGGDGDGAWTLATTTVGLGLKQGAATATVTSPGLTYAGHSLGSVKATLTTPATSSGWLPARVNIDASVTGLSPELLALVDDRFKPDEDIGDSIDFTITGRANPADVLRDSKATIIGKSRQLSIRAALAASNGAVRAVDEGVNIHLLHAGRLAGRFAPETLALDTGGWLRVRTKDLSLPLSGGLAIRGGVVIEGGNLGASMATSEHVGVTSMSVDASLGDSTSLKLALAGDVEKAGFDISGSFVQASDFAGILAAPEAIRPTGSLQIKGAPTSLVESLLPASVGHAAGVALGDSIEVTLTSATKQDGLDVVLTAGSGETKVNLLANVGADAAHVRSASVDVALKQAEARQIIQALSPETDARLRIRNDVRARVDVKPWSLPLTGGVSGTDPIEAALTVSQGAFLLRMASEEGPPEIVGPLDVSGAAVSASAPLSAFLGDGDAAVSMALNVTAREGDTAVGSVKGAIKTSMKAGAMAGPIQLTLDATDVATVWLDGVIGRKGLLSGALGPQVTLNASTDLAADVQTITATATAARFRTQSPAVIEIRDDRISLSKPLRGWWRLNPDFFASGVLRGSPLVGLRSPPVLEYTISSLVLSRGDGPFLPGVFDVAADVKADEVKILADGKVEADYSNFAVNLTRHAEADKVTVTLSLDDGQRRALDLTAVLDEFADAKGAPTFDRTVASIDAELPKGRADVIDAIAKQNGLLQEILGPTVDLTLKTHRYSKTGGSFTATAKSPRTQVEVDGVVGFGQFAASKPIQLTIDEITPKLGAFLTNGLPLGTIEKLPEDGPAVVLATGLKVPIDGDMSKLNGDVTIDVGHARFTTSSAFATILDMTRQQSKGFVGRNLDALTIHMRNGVISYDRYTIPLGEFKLQTEAKSIDLVNKSLNIVTWIPIGALGDEAAGQFNTGLGSALGRAFPTIDKLTNVPWRTKGSFGSTTTLPDVTLFIERTGSQLLRPDKLIRDRLQHIFGGGD